MKKLFSSFAVLGMFFSSLAQPSTIATIAGNGTAGYSGDNGLATSATLNFPVKVSSDINGNIYFADNGNNALRRIDAVTGIINTIAGNGTAGYSGDNGPANLAVLNGPWGVSLDGAGNIYFSDAGNNVIRRIDANTNIITTVAGNGTAGYSGDNGPALAASFNGITAIAADSAGNIYLTDDNNNRIRRVDVGTGIVTTIAGNGTQGFSGDNGPAVNATLNFPVGISVKNGILYLTDSDNNRIRKIDGSGIITTIAGNGSQGYNGDGIPATSATLYNPWDAVADNAGNVYIADFFNCRIRRVDATTGLISTYAGTSCGFSDGPVNTAQMNAPVGLCFDNTGNLIFVDSYSNRLRKVTPAGTLPPGVASAQTPYIGAGADLATYAGIPIQFMAHGGNSYLWTPSTGLSDTTDPRATVTINQTTTYVLRIDTGSGNYVYDTITVYAFPTSTQSFADCNNWVNNGDFENGPCPQCIWNMPQAGTLPTAWQNGNFATSDYYNACHSGGSCNGGISNCWTGVPCTGMGYQQGHNGSGAFGGFFLYGSPGQGYYEYYQQPLICPLVAGQNYDVSFWASWASYSNYAGSGIGALLSQGQPGFTGTGQVSGSPQISGNQGAVNNWLQYPSTGPLVITGAGEDYITIGNFTNPPTTHVQSIPNLNNDGDYVFLDDVVIKPIPPTIHVQPNASLVYCLGLGPAPTFTFHEQGSPPNACSWYGPGGFIGNGATVHVTPPSSPGVYTYTCNVNLNCVICPHIQSTISITVTPLQSGPPLTVNAPSPLCFDPQNPPTVGTMTVSGGTAPYVWAPIPPVTPNNLGWSHVHVTYTAAGTYTYAVSTTQCQGIGTATVIVNQAPAITVTPTLTPVCAGTTVTQTLTASSSVPNTTFTWTPSSGLNTNSGSTVVATVSSTIGYSVTGVDPVTGCSSGAFTTFSVVPNPTITVSAPTSVCAGGTVHIAASGAGSGPNSIYSINPSPPGTIQSVNHFTVTINSSTTFTVTGINANGCVGTHTVHINALPLPTISVVASPTVICPGATTTLTASGGANNTNSYSWLPTGNGIPGTNHTYTATPHPTAATTYTVTGTGGNGCTNTATVTVNMLPTPTITVNNPSICPHTAASLTATPTSGMTYTWTPGAGNPNANPHTTAVYNNPGTYTVQVKGTDAVTTCSSTATSTITVLTSPTVAVTFTTAGAGLCNAPPAPSFTNGICNGSSAVLTANSSGATSYTWMPGNLTGQTVTVSPTANIVYTVTALGGTCPGTGTFAIQVINCSCPGTTLPTGGTPTGGTWAVNANLVIPNTSTLTITNADVNIATGISITVNNGGVLNIVNSHLHPCSNMWKGIIVKPGGKITVSGNSLIEDAEIAIDNSTASATPAIIDVNGAVFNCNRIGIKKANYSNANSANYGLTKFKVDNSVFTCRCGIPYPVIMPNLNTYSGPGTVNNPTINDIYNVATNYALATLRNPVYPGEVPTAGINFIDNGVVNTFSATTTQPFVLQVGTTTGLTVFDNHYYGINATNTTFSVTNCAFQVPRQSPAGILQIPMDAGWGINAVNTNPSYYNGFYVQKSQFMRMIRAMNNSNYYDVLLTSNRIFSKQTIFPFGTGFLVPPEGDMGIYCNTPRFRSIQIRGNRFADINTCAYVRIDANSSYVSGANNQSVAAVTVATNTLSGQFTNTVTYPNTFIGTGIIVENVINAPHVPGPGAGQNTRINVQNNNISDAFDGILLRNHQYQLVRTEGNSVTLQYQPTMFTTETQQYGIEHDHVIHPDPTLKANDIYLNNIQGFSTNFSNQNTFEPKKGVWTRSCVNHYVACNDVTNAGRGFEFEGTNSQWFWYNNNMTSCGEGMALSANGIIGPAPQGSAANASDNQWFPSGSSIDLMCDQSTPTNSRIYVRPFGSYLPLNYSNKGTGSSPYVLFFDVLPSAGPNSYLCSTPPPQIVIKPDNGPATARSSQGSSALSSLDEVALYEAIVQDSVPYSIFPVESGAINKMLVYEVLSGDSGTLMSSSVLLNFYAACQAGNFGAISSISDNLYAGNTSVANGLLSTLVPSNSVEQNYKRFYEIYLNTELGSLAGTDSSDLETLANGCPPRDGAVVFQARALHNSYYNDYKHYNDNCPESSENRFTEVNNIPALHTVKIFPNPTTGKVYISCGDNINERGSIEVYDLSGKLILKQDIEIENGLGNIKLDAQNGAYMLYLEESNGKTTVHKVMLSK